MGTTNRYASGWTYLARRAGQAAGNQTLTRGGIFVGGELLTPVLAGIAVFQLSYDTTIAAQCAAGAL